MLPLFSPAAWVSPGYDTAGNVTTSTVMELNHTDANGINLTQGQQNFVQTTVFSWFDDAGRITATAAYGTNANGWQHAAVPTRPAPDPPPRSDTILVMPSLSGPTDTLRMPK